MNGRYRAGILISRAAGLGRGCVKTQNARRVGATACDSNKQSRMKSNVRARKCTAQNGPQGFLHSLGQKRPLPGDSVLTVSDRPRVCQNPNYMPCRFDSARFKSTKSREIEPTCPKMHCTISAPRVLTHSPPGAVIERTKLASTKRTLVDDGSLTRSRARSTTQIFTFLTRNGRVTMCAELTKQGDCDEAIVICSLRCGRDGE